MSDEPESGVNMVEGVNAAAEAFHIDLGDDDDDDDDFVGGDIAQQDGGTASVLGSAWQIKKYLRFLLEEGFDTHSVPMCHCEKGFKYGKSPKGTTNRCEALPIFVGDVLTYVIKGTAPILVGRPLLEQLRLTVDYQKKLMKWPDSDWETQLNIFFTLVMTFASASMMNHTKCFFQKTPKLMSVNRMSRASRDCLRR